MITHQTPNPIQTPTVTVCGDKQHPWSYNNSSPNCSAELYRYPAPGLDANSVKDASSTFVIDENWIVHKNGVYYLELTTSIGKKILVPIQIEK